MSLNYDYTACAETTDERQLAIRKHFMWVTMGIGIGEVTEANVAEVFQRVTMLDMVAGPSLYVGAEPLVFTLEDIKGLVGYKTNVFPKWTKTKFLNHMWNLHTRFNAQV